MSYQQFAANAVAKASESKRINFIRLTYIHLGGAVLAFAALCAALIQSPLAPALLAFIGGGMLNQLLFLGGFLFAGHIAHRWSMSDRSMQMQYLGLGAYVVVNAVVFTPILFVAANYSDPNAIPSAGVMTAVVFGGLTMMTMYTKQDFSFLGGVLRLATFAAIGVALCSMLFGFSLGIVFSTLMVVLAGGYILYETSAVMRHYPETAYVAASLRLFAAVALLFYYILRIFMNRD
ncbi:MAG: Bax inhibitor-1/YccA family protein [Bradymonadia bacterium]